MSQQDLAEMVTRPLALQVNKVGLQILRETRRVLELVEIIARQTTRNLQEEK